MLTDRSFQSGDLTLHFVLGPPAGGPLVCLHGVTRSWSDFSVLMPSLALRWKIHSLDFRGHGQSQRSAGEYLVVDYVRDVVTLIEKHVSEPVVLYGHSLGAMVAASVAAQLPDVVRGIVLEDPPFETMGTGIAETPFLAFFQGMQAVASMNGSVEELAAALGDIRLPAGRLGDLRDAVSLRYSASCLQSMDPETLTPINEGRWLDGYSWDDILQAVRCPALLLQADSAAGGMLPDDAAEQATRWMHNCTRIRVPEVGHLIHWVKPAETLCWVTQFLETL